MTTILLHSTTPTDDNSPMMMTPMNSTTTTTSHVTDKSNNKSVLVLLATGKLGLGICEAFVDQNWKVHGTSRNPQHPALLERGVIPVPFEYGSVESMENALSMSQPDVVVVITSMIKVSKTPTQDVRDAKIGLDAIVAYDSRRRRRSPTITVTPPFTILCSCDMAESCPDNVRHCKSKWHMEEYLKTLPLEYAILRPCSFLQNFNDPTVWNPLQYGSVKDLYPLEVGIPLVSTRNVGTAAMTMATNPHEWNLKTLLCVADKKTGHKCAEILTQVSQTPCTYSQAPPSLIQWLILGDLYHMVQYTTSKSHESQAQDILNFKKVVPDAMDTKEWFERLGQWSDGTKFGEVPEPTPSRNSTRVVATTVIVVAVAAVACQFYHVGAAHS